MNFDQIAKQVLVNALTPVKSAAGIMDWAKENPALATGIGSGVAGGLLTAGGRRQPGESRTRRTFRVLRNALLTGALGAGAVGAVRAGGNALSNALPADDVDPATRALTSGTLRGALGITGAGAGAYMSRNMGRSTEKPTRAILDLFNTAHTQEAAVPGSHGLAAQHRGQRLSRLAQNVLNAKPSNLEGLENMFSGAGEGNVRRVVDELGGHATATSRAKVMDDFLRAGINTAGPGGGWRGGLKRNLVNPAKMLAYRHLTAGRVGSIVGGTAAGAFAPEIARGVIGLGSDSE